MNSEFMNIESITPIELIIKNHDTPAKKTLLQLNIERQSKRTESDFKFFISASVYKESEQALEEKTYFIKYSLEAHFCCNSEDMSDKALEKEATIALYPYIRAGISATMAAIGMEQFTLPLFITAHIPD